MSLGAIAYVSVPIVVREAVGKSHQQPIEVIFGHHRGCSNRSSVTVAFDDWLGLIWTSFGDIRPVNQHNPTIAKVC